MVTRVRGRRGRRLRATCSERQDRRKQQSRQPDVRKAAHLREYKATTPTAGLGRATLRALTALPLWKPLEGDGIVPWRLVGDGSMLVVTGTGNIVSRRTFESFFVHVEYKTPLLAASVTGQDRGNSGIYLKGMYEMQVLDSFGRLPEIDGAGSLCGVRAPLVNSSFAEEIWNTDEIDFTAPSYDGGGNKLTNARITAHLNGDLVQDDTEAPTSTDPARPEAVGPGP